MASALDYGNDNQHPTRSTGTEILWLRIRNAHAPICADESIGGRQSGSFAQEISVADQSAGSSRRKRDLAERLDQRHLQLALHAAEDPVGVLQGHRRLVWPDLDQRGED